MLPYFDPTDTAPHLLIDREREREWLRIRLLDYLRRTEDTNPTGRSLAIIGDKGVGKTILARAVLNELKASREVGGRALFLSVDCRNARSGRDVLTEVAQQAVEALDRERQLDKAKPLMPLLDLARILRTLCSFDGDAELKAVHEHLLQFKKALNLKNGELLKRLGLDFGISLEHSDKQLTTLEGKLRFDDKRLGRALASLLRDIRGQGLHVALHLDNIDELRHEGYQDSGIRAQTHQDVETVLALTEAPVYLLLGLRTYFQRSVQRKVTQTLRLEQLAAPHLQELLWPRLKDTLRTDELAVLRAALGSGEPLGQDLIRLAGWSRTPLAFLAWLQARLDDHRPELGACLRSYLRTHYASLPEPVLEDVVRVFVRPDQPVPAAQILKACGDNQAVYSQLLDRQVVLPLDYWNPTDFTLDPALDFLFWQIKGQQAAVQAARL